VLDFFRRHHNRTNLSGRCALPFFLSTSSPYASSRLRSLTFRDSAVREMSFDRLPCITGYFMSEPPPLFAGPFFARMVNVFPIRRSSGLASSVPGCLKSRFPLFSYRIPLHSSKLSLCLPPSPRIPVNPLIFSYESVWRISFVLIFFPSPTPPMLRLFKRVKAFAAFTLRTGNLFIPAS